MFIMSNVESLLPFRSTSAFGILISGVDHSRDEDCATKSFGDREARKAAGPLNPVATVHSTTNMQTHDLIIIT